MIAGRLLKNITRRSLLVGTGATIGIAGTSYLSNEKIPFGARFPKTIVGNNILNDASLLSPTNVSKHIILKDNSKEKTIALLRDELKSAKSENRPFIASAARHSMGGQSLVKDGVVVTNNQNWIEIDNKQSIYRTAAGARWSEIVTNLDKVGFSPKVMQSNNDFAVGSTFCVNAHGWPVPHSACGSTVRSIRLMLHDGQIINCSRAENTDQFNLAMGGYGLNGIILDMDVEMVPNARLNPVFDTIPAKDFGIKFVEKIKANPAIEMAYGRLDVSIENFFEEALIITYTPDADQSDLPAAAGPNFIAKTSKHIFRGQLNSDRIKSARWYIEKKIGPKLDSGKATRNTLLNEPFSNLEENDPNRTDILHEYFISPERFGEFITACQEVIPSSYQQLLNITLRFVDTDNESVLAYAPVPRIAAVMLFSQEMSQRGEDDMRRMTSALIEKTLEIGGTYYLPYRPHATQKQFESGYNRAQEFATKKRLSDPNLVFQNNLWNHYMVNL